MEQSDLKDTEDEEQLEEQDDEAEAEPSRNVKFEKSLMRLFIVCALLLAGELIWLFVLSPSMPLNAVNITGIDSLNRILVLDKAGVTAHTSYFSFNIKKAEEALLTLPEIARADISKKFPDTVNITLHARTGAALALVKRGYRYVPVIFDQEGVVFQIGDAEGLASRGTLPLLSGLVFENLRTGLRLPDFLVPLLKDIKELGDTAPELLSAVSELQINKKGNEGFEVTVYPVSNPVRIKIGASLTAEKLSYALLLLDVLKERHINIESEIDFRSGTASYKVKE